MPLVIDENFATEDLEYDEFKVFPSVSDDIQKTLARLLAWNEETERFMRLRADNKGRLVVALGGTTAANFDISVYSVSTIPQRIVAQRTARYKVRILNDGADVLYIGPNSNVTNLNGYPISPGEEFVEDLYTGNIYGISYGLGTTVIVLDY